MNKSYMKWLKDSHKNISIFLLIIEIILGFLPFLMQKGMNGSSQQTILGSYETGIAMITIASLAAAVILPMLFFSYIHKKSSVDLYFSLPVSRKHQLITTTVFLFVMINFSYLFSTLLIWIIYGHSSVSFLKWLLPLPWMMYGVLVILLATICVYTLTNNIFDGVVMVCAYTFVPAVIGMACDAFATGIVAGQPYPLTGDLWQYFSPVWMTGHNVAGIITISQFVFKVSFIPVLACYLIVSLIGLKFNFINRKGERAEQISDNFFAYPFIANLYLFLLLLSSVFSSFGSSTDGSDLIFFFLLFLCYVVAAFVYRRSMKFHWTDLIRYGAALGISFGIAWSAWNSHGFGIADRYHLFTDRYQIYDYTVMVQPDDLGKLSDSSDLSVNVTLEIPTNEKEKYQKATEIMEKLRKKQINHYYAHENSYSGNLNVYNTDRPQTEDGWKTTNSWTYDVDAALSEKDLKILDQYAAITVYRSDSPGSVSLSKYLAERKK